jgi:hypothetical protein
MRMLTDADVDVSTPFMMRIEESLASAHSGADELVSPIRTAMSALVDATTCARNLKADSRAAVAYDLMTAYGILAIAWTWVDLVMAATRAGDTATVEAKRVLARVWMQSELPLVHALCARVANGGTALLELQDDLV